MDHVEAALSVSQEGDGFSRFAVHADGSLAWAKTTKPKNNGSDSNATVVVGPGYDTILRRPIARAVQWAPPRLIANGHATTDIAVDSAEPGGELNAKALHLRASCVQWHPCAALWPSLMKNVRFALHKMRCPLA